LKIRLPQRVGKALLAEERSAVFRYGVVTAAVLTATCVRLGLNPSLGPHAPYLPFALAIMFAARIGGRRPGYAATALSALSAFCFLVEPQAAPSLWNSGAIAGLALFVLVGVLISLLVGHLRESLLSTARAEDILRRKTQLVDLSHDAIITADSSRRITSWNAGAAEMYGWTESEALGKIIHDFLGTTSGISTAGIDEILHRGGRWDGELNHVAKDGRRLVVESRHMLVRDDAQVPVGILEINRDLSERKRSEEALVRSEAQFRTLANAIPQLCWMANADGWIFWYNDRWYEYTGTTQQDMEGWGWQSVHDPGVLPDVLMRWKLSIASGQPFDMVFPLRGGDGAFRFFLTRVMPLRDADGTIVRWFGTNTDITEERKTEAALRQASEQRGLALESAQMGAWDYRFDTGDVYWDERARRMFGVSTGQIKYDAAIARIHADDQVPAKEAMKQAIQGANDGAYHREYRVVWPDGSVRWVASHGRVLFEGDGDKRRPIRLVGINMDITDRRHAEERLRQTQKLESIGLLAGGVAHDFNNILTVIMGRASTALAECPSCEHSQSILAASERAAYLTRQLLAYAGKAHNVVKLVDLTAVVSQSISLISASVPKRVTLRYNLSKDLPCLEADPACVEQILMNLVVNAGEAIPPKADGVIEIATTSAEVTPEMARLHSKTYDVAAGRYVCLEVRDNGEGMDELTASRIFDPFFTTKFTGRGLGLAALEGIVRTSKGFVEVRSSSGCGTTFRVFLPASDKARPTVQEGGAPRQQLRGSGTILVVDDEDPVRKLASRVLRRHGYEVQEAEDGKDALRVLAGSSAQPSLVLLDLAMPVMGGDELVPILEATYPGLKILISSGYPEEQARKLAPNPSVVSFLQKPYTGVALAEKVAQVLMPAFRKTALHESDSTGRRADRAS
jgi:PAS domain S-box-containing protein